MDFNFKKAQQSLDNLPFGKRLSAVTNLVKSSISVIGKDEDIIKPWIRMMLYNLIMVLAFFYFLLGFWLPFSWHGLGLPLAFSLFLYKHFYNNKQEMRLSWTVYETIIGHDPSYKTAKQACKKVQPTTRRIAWLDIGMSTLEKSKWFGSGIVAIIMRLFITGLEEVWDLANHYLIPSVAIDRHDFKESFTKMKGLKNQVPETLAGVFGIDFIGSVVRRSVWPVYAGLVIVSLFLSFWLGFIFPSISTRMTVNLPSFITDSNYVMMTWVPIIAAFGIGKIFSVFFERTITAMKVVYFTVFYTKITHPDRITDAYKEELLAYLKMENVDEVTDLDKQAVEEPDTQAAAVRPATP